MLDGVTFLLTCPIDLYATATVELREGDGKISAPSDSSKAALALQYTLEFLGLGDRLDAKLYLESPLPRGKGMASSTADVAATVVATAHAAGRPMNDDEIAEIALRIEPSDGLMYSGITRFDHRLGSHAQELGDPPPMQVVILDFGGTVDTLQFNDVDVSASLISSEEGLRGAVELIAQGIQESDVEKIGKGSTLSARANQAILYKPLLESAIALASETGAAGVNVAHSGTVIGMLFDDEEIRVRRAASLAWERLAGLKSVRCQRVIGGGVAVKATREVLRI